MEYVIGFIVGVVVAVMALAAWLFWDYKNALWINDKWEDIYVAPKVKRTTKTTTKGAPAPTIKVKKTTKGTK
jgi:hypothetical protein